MGVQYGEHTPVLEVSTADLTFMTVLVSRWDEVWLLIGVSPLAAEQYSQLT